MPEKKYGVYAQLVKSIATTPVSTDTTVVFIGASPKGDPNKAYLISSLSDYREKLGGEPGDGYNLTEAAIAAFSVAGISRVYMIPVTNEKAFDEADYLGDAAKFTGVYAIENLLRENPTTVNILCAPSIIEPSVLSALNTIAKKADGHWASFMVYDIDSGESGQQFVNENDVVQPDAVVKYKLLSDEYASAVFGRIKTAGGYVISGAAVRACLMAAADAEFGAPARSGGNLHTPRMADYGVLVKNQENNETTFRSAVLTESTATQLSADGVCSWVNYGGGNWYTWGDHTSVFSNASVPDERARYDSNMRILLMLTNRFQLKYRFSIDAPMTLTVRNDIIQEENDYLAYLKSIGAIVGDASCEFKATDNPTDAVAQGQFVWSIEATVTPPLKYAQLNVAYSQSGLSVYYQ